jgi:RND superfamily putative drug exporter
VGKLARWCAYHRNLVVTGWVAVFLALVALVGVAGTRFSDATRLPASDSSTAYALIGHAGSAAASAKTGIVVWKDATGSAISATDKAAVEPVLAQIGQVDGVKAVVSPFQAGGAGQVSTDTHTAYATVIFTSTQHTKTAQSLARQIRRNGLKVQTGGAAFANQTPSEATEAIGLAAALIILLLVFRSAWAAALPIITGVVGVGVSSVAVMLLSHVLSLSSTALSLGALIGLGVGIDYALLVVNRQRKALAEGASVPDAIAVAMSTSGRAVLFAGGTVMAALLGMLILNVGFLSGMSVAAALTVFLTVAAALTLLPALLAKLGPRVLGKKDRGNYRAAAAARCAAGVMPARSAPVLPAGDAPAVPGLWGRWARLVARRPRATGLVAMAVLIVLAVPALGIRLGSADASSDPSGSSTRSYYTTMASAFGPGFDSQLLLVAQTPDVAAQHAWTGLVDQLPKTHGVAAVSTPTSLTGDTLSMVTVTPTTTSQAKATSALVHDLRSQVITRAEQGSDLRVYVGGATATSIDFSNALTRKLPLFLVIIAVLGFLLLTLAFRSLLVPAIGALGNLVTIAVALGTTVFLFQWGHGPALFGIGGGAPLEYIVAMLIVGVMFGLSMDYHVFLVSRKHEEWLRTRNNRRAITVGQADTGRVIATAAAIMACVFASFGLSGMRLSAEFGVGLAVAVLADAFLLRMTVIPAIMHLLGDRNWTLPAWLDGIMPHVSVEGPAAAAAVPEQPAAQRNKPIPVP